MLLKRLCLKITSGSILLVLCGVSERAVCWVCLMKLKTESGFGDLVLSDSVCNLVIFVYKQLKKYLTLLTSIFIAQLFSANSNISHVI